MFFVEDSTFNEDQKVLRRKKKYSRKYIKSESCVKINFLKNFFQRKAGLLEISMENLKRL